MQGLADGYFIIPYTVGHYISTSRPEPVTTDHPEFKKSAEDVDARLKKFLSINGSRTVKEFHRDLGRIMWENVGMARNRAGLESAIEEIRQLRAEFRENVRVTGNGETLNKDLEFAGRVADFLELGELLARDALDREESCGGHFREESQTEEGEAKRDDDNFSYVSAWEYKGVDQTPQLYKEALDFENVQLTSRSYK